MFARIKDTRCRNQCESCAKDKSKTKTKQVQLHVGMQIEFIKPKRAGLFYERCKEAVLSGEFTGVCTTLRATSQETN